jgi:hypothetical protein
MLPRKLLLRAALRLRRAWPSAPAQPHTAGRRALDALDGRLRDLQRTRRLLDKAAGRGLDLAAAQLRLDLVRQVEAVSVAAAQAREALGRPAAAVPSLADLAAELRQVEAEFGGLTVLWKERAVAAATEPVTLEGVALGAFEVRLCWDALGQGAGVGSFEVVALDPNPAAGDERVTHPHVRSRRLCAGDAEAALGQALTEGRLADAFCLVRAVLVHYNADSPHVRLDEWGGSECHDCGRTVGDDEQSACAGCEEDVCDDCLSRCPACGGDFCGDCLSGCAVCGADCCGSCLRRPPLSRRACCPACLGACPRCGRQAPRDELDAQTRLCRDCRPAAPPPSSSSVPLPLEEPHAPTLETVAPAPG